MEYIKYIKDEWFNLMYSIDVNTMGSQSVRSILWHNVAYVITLSNKVIVLTYTI